MTMQEKGYMTSYLVLRWMDHFIQQLEELEDLSPTNTHLIILDGHKSHVSLKVIKKAKAHGVDMISLPSHTSHVLQPLDVACFKPFKTTFKAYRNKWTIQKNGEKVEKQTLAHWVDLSLKRALSTSNIKVGFRATGIWPLNLEKMQHHMGPSRTIHSRPSEKLMEYEIMEDDLPEGAENARHFYIEKEEGAIAAEVSGEPETPSRIGQFLKLPQRMIQAPRIVDEPLFDYSQS